jgi:hypothetical protein
LMKMYIDGEKDETPLDGGRTVVSLRSRSQN